MSRKIVIFYTYFLYNYNVSIQDEIEAIKSIITEILSGVSVSSQQLQSHSRIVIKKLDGDQLNIFRKAEDSLKSLIGFYKNLFFHELWLLYFVKPFILPIKPLWHANKHFFFVPSAEKCR